MLDGCRLVAFALAIALTGCGDPQPLDATTGIPDIPDPSPTPTASLQTTAAVAGLVSTLIQAAANDIIRRGTDGNVVIRAAGLRQATTTPVDVSLDFLGASGDTFPDATGSFRLSADKELFVPSWPSGTSGTGKALLTISFSGTSPLSASYTDPASGAVASINSGTIIVNLDLTWSKDSGPTPTTQTMTVVTTVGPAVPGTSLSCIGTVVRDRTTTSWSLAGNRRLEQVLTRSSGQPNTFNLVSTNAGNSSWVVTLASGEVVTWTRAGLNVISAISSQVTGTVDAGTVVDLPTRRSVHGDLDRW
ncbi:hypothetical protein LBMAG53_10030 [Planctomycetota bacterium]|nr:hypothetical protein LBMAG53_10030 [Planctomycetota bacterium]